MDSAIFEKDLVVQLRSRAAKGQSCKRHSQCSRMFCASKCNMETRLCSGRPASSNFVVSMYLLLSDTRTAILHQDESFHGLI